MLVDVGQGEGEGAGYGGCGREGFGGGGSVELRHGGEEGRLDVSEGAVVVCVVGCSCLIALCHLRVLVRAVRCASVGGAVRRSRVILYWEGVQEFGALGVRGDDGDFVAVVEGEVGVDEDEEVGDGGGEGEGRGEEGPCVGIRVEDHGQQGGRGL